MTITRLRYGTTTPNNSVGLDGDFYINTTTGDLYQKVSGTYTLAALGGSSVGGDLYLFNNY